MVNTYRPKNLREALSVRASEGAIPFAGGTDLMVRYRYESGAVPDFPGAVLFLNHLEELRRIHRLDHGLSVGAGLTLTELIGNGEVPALLREAVATIAAPAIRNVATLAGNICNASPAGDSICALYALDAGVKLKSADAERVLPIYRFILGPGKTDLRKDEILTEIIIPEDRSTAHSFRKVGTRRANALSKLSLAGSVRISGDRVDEVRIAVGAVAPTVVRSLELEKSMAGLSLTELARKLEEVLQGYEVMIQPIDDQRSTAVYRKKVAMNLLRKFFETTVLGGGVRR
jgi:CO/xanthine dehydrogenase FAD-binding subunit